MVPGIQGYTAYTWGQVMAAVRQMYAVHAGNNSEPTAPVWTFAYELTTDKGFRLLKMRITGDGVLYSAMDVYLVFLAFDEIAPARMVVSEAGWNGAGGAGFKTPGTDAGLFLWDHLAADWRLHVGGIKRAIFEQWTTGTVIGAGQMEEMLWGGDFLGTAIDAFIVATDSELLISYEQLRGYAIGYLDEEGDPTAAAAESPIPPDIAPSGAVSITVQTRELVQAVQDVAALDVGVQLNDRGPIFSVRGKTIAGG